MRSPKVTTEVRVSLLKELRWNILAFHSKLSPKSHKIHLSCNYTRGNKRGCPAVCRKLVWRPKLSCGLSFQVLLPISYVAPALVFSAEGNEQPNCGILNPMSHHTLRLSLEQIRVEAGRRICPLQWYQSHCGSFCRAALAGPQPFQPGQSGWISWRQFILSSLQVSVFPLEDRTPHPVDWKDHLDCRSSEMSPRLFPALAEVPLGTPGQLEQVLQPFGEPSELSEAWWGEYLHFQGKLLKEWHRRRWRILDVVA